MTYSPVATMPLEQMTVGQLRILGRALGVERMSDMRRGELVAAITAARKKAAADARIAEHKAAIAATLERTRT